MSDGAAVRRSLPAPSLNNLEGLIMDALDPAIDLHRHFLRVEIE